MTRRITLKPGKNISYQIHHHRAETWTFVQGEGIFVLDGLELHVKVGDTVHIPVEHYHAIKSITELTFIEVQCGNPLIKEDFEKYEWEWKEELLDMFKYYPFTNIGGIVYKITNEHIYHTSR